MINHLSLKLFLSKFCLSDNKLCFCKSLRFYPRGKIFSSARRFSGRWMFKLKAMFGPPVNTLFNVDSKGNFSLSLMSMESDSNRDLFTFVSSVYDGFIYSFGYINSGSVLQVKGFVKLYVQGDQVFISKPKKTFEMAYGSSANILFAEKCVD